jgi:hypothetical protein
MPRGVNKYDEARLQGRLWNPLTLSPIHWLDASDISTITVSTGVSQWRDKSGRGFHASQSTTGNQPAYIVGGINGLNVLRFDGINDAMVHTANVSPAPHTTFCVSRRLTGGSTDYQLIYAAIQTSAPFGVNLHAKALGSLNWGSFINSWTFSGTTLDIGGVNILGIVSPTSTSGTELYSTNGTQSGQSYLQRYPGDSNDRRAIGLDVAFNSGAFSGDIAEIIVFSTNLSTRAIKIVEGYLAWKWGLASNLPASHTFKNRPPVIGD